MNLMPAGIVTFIVGIAYTIQSVRLFGMNWFPQSVEEMTVDGIAFLIMAVGILMMGVSTK